MIANNKLHFVLMQLFAGGLLMTGCETPPGPYVPKSCVAPALVNCNDNTGHKPGSKPWIMGGTCCCTPGDELMAQLQKDGFCAGMTADQLREQYEQAGIALKGPKHQCCSGLCAAGPHVVLGGKCMCPPTPGTPYFEQIVSAPPRGAATQPSPKPGEKK